MNPDDPKLTAYALDELDPAERAEIEQLLREDPAARAEVEEMMNFIARLRGELKAEAGAPLTEEQKATVLGAAGSQHEPYNVDLTAPPQAGRWPQRWLPIAAGIVVVAGVASLVLKQSSFVVENSMEAAPDFVAEGGASEIGAKIFPTPEEKGREAQVAPNAATPPPVMISSITTSAPPPSPSTDLPASSSKPTTSPAALAAASPAKSLESEAATIRLSPDVAKNEVSLTVPAEKPAMAFSDTSVATSVSGPSPTTRTENFSGTTVSGQLTTFAGGNQLKSGSGTVTVGGKDLESAPGRSSFLTPANLATAPLSAAASTRQGGMVRSDGVPELSKSNTSAATVAGRSLASPPPPPASGAVARGIEHYKAARYDEAVNELTKALAANPADAVAHNYLGVAASQKGWAEAAQKELETAARIDPTYADARFNLAVVLATRQPPKQEEARRSYQLALQLGAERDQELERLIGQSGTGNTEAYDAITDNAFLAVGENPLSTFSIDVDTASYANVRRFLTQQQALPPKGAVRIEELLNYFTYDYPQPEGDAPFSATMEVAACPWEPEHRLVRVGLKGREIVKAKRPASNLVFLIDVSGSMQPENKLPLLKKCLALLVDQLSPEDTVSIAVYAGASGTVLEPTHDRGEIRAALDRLESGGSTNGAAGIQLAYRLAEQSFIKGGVNRVILATDGDFNVGVTSQSELTELITRKAKGGTFLTVLGFGMGNLKDSTLEKLADKGDGNYAYIDTLAEGRKVLVEQMNGTLVTIAKDVKIQVEFNPAQVSSYRLIGYENRLLAKEDFNDDKKDAGEIGAGHTVTALYEVVPAGVKAPGRPAVDELKYQPRSTSTDAAPAAPFQLKGTPEDSFVDGYQTVQKAEQAEQGGNLQTALNGYRAAEAMFIQIARTFPDWKPSIVAYRQQRTDEAITRLERQLPPSPRTPAASPTQAEKELVALKPDASVNPQSPIRNPQSTELLTLKLRYKQPDGDTSKLLEFPLTDRGETWEKSSRDFRFAAAVAGFGMLLRESPHKGSATWETIRELAVEGQGEDRSGYRAEFLTMIDKAKALGR